MPPDRRPLRFPQTGCGTAFCSRKRKRIWWRAQATWRAFLTAWDDYRVEAREYHELDAERVLVTLRAQGRGKASGLDIGATGGGRGSANVFHVRGGKVTRLVSYFDRDRALADVGLATADDDGECRSRRSAAR